MKNKFLCFCASVANLNLRKQILFIFFVAFFCEAKAQAPKSYTSSEILLQLKKLNVLGSVLYVAAHPDDENTRLLAYLANEKLYRTGYLSLTRGDGGQNLIGDEQGVDLGLIRTQELLAARRIDGAEQFFTRAFDFGYSKSPDETMKFWGHDKVLSDVVWVIRKFRPDVIITRFPATGEGGHGHHTASAILAGEAFDAAADPTKFPEQLTNGVTVWQAKRILWNTFSFGGNNTTREDQFKMECGDYNPILGKSYGEIAAASRSQHKSQGFGVPAQRGSVIEYLKIIKGSAPVNDLFDDVDISWKRTADASLANTVNKIIEKFDVSHPERAVAALVDLYKKIEVLKDDYWKEQKLHAVKEIIQNCSGLFMDATTNTQYAIPGDSLKINLVVNNRSGANILSADAHINNDFIIFDQLKKNANAVQTYTMFLRPGAKLTQPYWLQNPMEKGSFNVTDQQLIGRAENDPFSIVFSMLIEGKEFKFTKPVRYKYTDPVKGELYQPVNIIPAFSVRSVPKLGINNYKNDWEVKSFKDKNPFKSYVKTEKTRSVVGYNNDTVLAKGQMIRLLDKPMITRVPVYDSLGNRLYLIYHDTLFQENGNPYLGLHQIDYDHIPSIIYTQPEVFTSKEFDLKTEGNFVGYIPGAGDKVPEALLAMGYKVITLQEADIKASNLKQFDAIVTGVRAYNTNEWMNNVYSELMDYVKEGGVLLVQYNTSNQIGPVKAKISPYPFNISRNRITDEEAKVNFLIPDHPALNHPNKITDADFNGWIQERSIYHAEKADTAYKAILSMKDPGEKEQDGSLIIANYGKGRFVYTGLVFFRELPAGVPGAYRLFANLIANKRTRYIK
ncbi:MAG: PIG-L family deacetylase [Chitinophagaceae bacterium]|nr:PIG-L family deacetylase [Chitinophagaceae bacterium]